MNARILDMQSAHLCMTTMKRGTRWNLAGLSKAGGLLSYGYHKVWREDLNSWKRNSPLECWAQTASQSNCQPLFNWVVHHSFCRCLYTGNIFKSLSVHLIQTQGTITFFFFTPQKVPDMFSLCSIIVLLFFSSCRIYSIDWLIVLITLIHHNPANLSDQGW